VGLDHTVLEKKTGCIPSGIQNLSDQYLGHRRFLRFLMQLNQASRFWLFSAFDLPDDANCIRMGKVIHPGPDSCPELDAT
jgi:hypothetical protein